MFWAFLRAHFNRCSVARAKMSLSRAQNININSIVLLPLQRFRPEGEIPRRHPSSLQLCVYMKSTYS